MPPFYIWSHSCISVSYTHLDVYKRQGYEPKNGEPRVVPIAQSTTYTYDSAETMGKLFDLDVYKRQTLCMVQLQMKVYLHMSKKH